MNPILQAINSGYDPDKILQYLSKSIPQLAGAIFKAKGAGYTVKQILGFLAKTSSQEDTKDLSNPEIRKRNRINNDNLVKNGLTMAAGAVGAATLGRTAVGAIAQRLPGQSTRGTPNAPGTSHMPQTRTPSTAQGLPPTQQTQVGLPAQTPITSPQTSVSYSPQQPPVSNPNISTQPVKTINAKEILDSSKATPQVKTLLESGNDPNQVGGYFRKFHQNVVNQIEKETGKSFEDIISEYAKEQPEQISKKPEAITEIQNEQKIPSILPNEEEIEESVFTPSGKGTIKEISGDNALIEEDGKLKQHKLDKVIESPLPEKDLAELYEDLKKGIEKHTGKQISRNVESAGYDPKNNELVYKPHGSDKFYVYDDISPEDADALTNLLTLRKSTGQNHIGVWEAGTESPIGAAMYQLIRKLQAERGGKGNEYKNRFETIYDALEPAKEALKKKYAEAKKKTKKPRAS